MLNEWRFSGEIVKIKELEKYDVGANLVVRGVAQRRNNESAGIVELPVVVQSDLWVELCSKGIRPYSVIEMLGHFETWVKSATLD